MLRNTYEHYEHYAFHHGLVQRFIPPEIYLKIIFKNGNSKEQLSTFDDFVARKAGLQCFICTAQFVILQRLFEHYAREHFSILTEKYQDLCTPDCSGFRLRGYKGVIHLAYVHDAINDFIPQDQPLPKQLRSSPFPGNEAIQLPQILGKGTKVNATEATKSFNSPEEPPAKGNKAFKIPQRTSSKDQSLHYSHP